MLHEDRNSCCGFLPLLLDNLMLMKMKYYYCWILLLFCLPVTGISQNTKDKSKKENVYHDPFERQCELLREKVEKERKPGTPSPDFEYTDIHGKKVSLKKFRGKYVFIDVWATWCGPCKKEMPFLHELIKKMAKKKIAFVCIAEDREREVWEKMVNGKNWSDIGVQLNMGKDDSFREAYGINSFPRFILLDKKGRVVNPYMTRPSDPETLKTLQALKGI